MTMYNPPHPGEVLREDYFKPLGLSVTEAAKGLDISKKQLSQIVNGKAGISPAMALKLAHAFDTTPQLWLNMQDQYDLWHAEKDIDLDTVASWHKNTPMENAKQL
ncbi:MAG: HigA family addiction module antitoxin [Candidatus Latescibacteria bacterium]|nr:HigA family addiction module antitoxin [Candidatus Latescibacterota bacterium]